jgi:hypothetical protein
MSPTNHRFVVYDLSLEMARKCHAVVGVLRRVDAELADQLHRACVSVVLNVAPRARSLGQRCLSLLSHRAW